MAKWTNQAINKNARRGVLLLIILGILAMFGMLAIALVVVARHAKETAEMNQRMDQQTTSPAGDLEGAFLQIVRGTTNPNSVIGPHGLLEDIYGNRSTTGNVGVWPAGTFTDPPESPYGICDGQLIEFTCGYTVVATGVTTEIGEVEARRSVGCVLTMLSGAAAGQSTHVVGYRVVRVENPPGTFTDYHRFQIVAFAGVSSAAVIANTAEYNSSDPDYLINGAAFSGTGFGFDSTLPDPTPNVKLDRTDSGGRPFALLPNPSNAAYLPGANEYQTFLAVGPDGAPGVAGVDDDGANGIDDPGEIGWPGSDDGLTLANEDYDAPDYQNMLLALQLPNGSVPIPSLYRLALVNYWYNKMRAGTAGIPWGTMTDAADRWKAVLKPWGEDGVPNNDDDYAPSGAGDAIVALKQRCTLRAFEEELPNIEGWGVAALQKWYNYVTWDVDNDGDGVLDSVWVDLGDSARANADGRRYRPLYAIHCIDLDGRLNLNAHGSLVQCDANYSANVVSSPLTFAGGATSVPLPRGQGFGPAEINLFPLLGATEYSQLLTGGAGFRGRYGASAVPGVSGNDPLSANKLFIFFPGYSYWDTLGVFGTPLDPKGSLAVGIDLRGQPVYRVVNNDWTNPAVNDPYELDLSQSAARAANSNATDNPFSPGELERLLRPYDIDASTLPRRLRDLTYDDNGTPLDLSDDRDLIQHRAEVTTESWDPPVPNLALPDGLRTALGGVAYHVSDLLEAKGVGTASAMSDLLPPEVLAGLRFDLNRPFGNGRDDGDGVDNNSDGQIDEAGEPGDTVLNGVVDESEEAANAEYLPLLDANSASITPDVPFDANNDGFHNTDDQDARQLYARHLYVLLMALVDEAWYPPGSDTSGSFDQVAARAKALAQFAVNVVDFRDRDSIMTPFEYDPYPFVQNGSAVSGVWNVDGNLATDDALTKPDGVTPIPHGQYVVWGCERPELLISESLAFHDRRTENLNTAGASDEFTKDATHTDANDTDPNFDQQYRPQGSFFLELFNPWTSDEPSPAELYDGAGDGVDLSKKTPTVGGEWSYVWKLEIVRNDDSGTPLTLDPDDPDATKRPTAERSVYFGDLTTGAKTPSDTDDGKRYYTKASVEPIPSNGYAVIGSANKSGPNPLVTYIGFEQGQSDGILNSTRQITLDEATVTAGPPLVVRHNEPTVPQPSSSQVYPPVLVPISEPQRLSITEPIDGYGLPPGSDYDPNTGRYDIPGDEPQDKADATVWKAVKNSGTAPSFAKVYLKRLADPLKPWAPEDDPNYPNPYRTIDAMTVDLTAFNGVTNASNADPAGDSDQNNTGTDTSDAFAALQRGTAKGADINPWKQEPPHTGVDNDPSPDLTALHYFGRPLADSLGYLNTPLGSPRDNTIAGYKGASDATPVFPWFTWNNRPFASPMELTQVPANRSSLLLAVGNFGGYTDAPGFDMLPTANPYKDPLGNFPHLLNFFYSDGTGPPPGDFYRLFEYVQVPSPFVGTEIQGDPGTFGLPYEDVNGNGVLDLGEDLNANGILDPPHNFHPPFNGISRYRDPGKINLNTITSPLVWKGLIDKSWNPGFSNFIASRRGYPVTGAPTDNDKMKAMVPEYPTRFANPFRSFEGSELVPFGMLKTKIIGDGVNATLMRGIPKHTGVTGPPINPPLFAFTGSTPEYANPDRNPYFRYIDFQKLGNLVTTRSNVYAIWITVGYFEVGDDGSLGAELGTETGDIVRHRAFYIFDRSIPVGFQRGQDLNVERAVLLKRYIE